MPPSSELYRFEIAFSFAGPHRAKIKAIAEIVATAIGDNKVFFDEWYEHEILGDDMDALLQRIYLHQSLMVVADISEAYADRVWTQAEARAIRALRFDIDPARDETGRLRLLNMRLAEGNVPGVFKTTGFLDGVNYSAQQCASTILKRLALLKERIANENGQDIAPIAKPDANDELVVKDSGNWVLIGSHFFESESVRTAADGVITVLVSSHDAADDAEIAALSPTRWHNSDPIGYAYRHDAVVVRVQSVENESANCGHCWIIKLKPQEATYGGGLMTEISTSCGGRRYSADQIAELRARRLLLNDAFSMAKSNPNSKGGAFDTLEMFICGFNTQYPAKSCVFPALYLQFSENSKRFMEIARLQAIFALKASQVFERVTELALGPIRDGRMHVRCKGRRRQVYTNVPAPTLEIEGECFLA